MVATPRNPPPSSPKWLCHHNNCNAIAAKQSAGEADDLNSTRIRRRDGVEYEGEEGNHLFS